MLLPCYVFTIQGSDRFLSNLVSRSLHFRLHIRHPHSDQRMGYQLKTVNKGKDKKLEYQRMVIVFWRMCFLTWECKTNKRQYKTYWNA